MATLIEGFEGGAVGTAIDATTVPTLQAGNAVFGTGGHTGQCARFDSTAGGPSSSANLYLDAIPDLASVEAWYQIPAFTTTSFLSGILATAGPGTPRTAHAAAWQAYGSATGVVGVPMGRLMLKDAYGNTVVGDTTVPVGSWFKLSVTALGVATITDAADAVLLSASVTGVAITDGDGVFQAITTAGDDVSAGGLILMDDLAYTGGTPPPTFVADPVRRRFS